MNKFIGILFAVVALSFIGTAVAEDPTPAPPAGANMSNNWTVPPTNETVPLNATSAEVESLNITGLVP